jgi:hypothetical protein
MNRRAGAALFVAMALLFLIANRGAYKSYFQDDELDNISWAPDVPKIDFLTGVLTPKFLAGNFRPAGHLYFALMGKYFGLDFPKYLFPIHALHLLNVWLLWLIARRLGLSLFAAGAGALFFAFNMVVFDVYWKPMYVFDLLCTTFCLASLLFYMRRLLLLSFVAFWMAYKSKELAVMLPFVLAAYEYWFGKRQWKRLLPFVAVSLCFGLQGVFLNPNRNNDYTFHFGPASISKTTAFYARNILLIPYASLALPLILLTSPDRRVWLGMAALALFFVPLLLLPDRTFDAYCYLPLTGLAIACAGVAETRPRALIVLFFLLWIPWNEFTLWRKRRQSLAAADENRVYVKTTIDAVRLHPDTRTFIYDGTPAGMHSWGILGTLRLATRDAGVHLSSVEAKNLRQELESGNVTILSWDSTYKKLAVAARTAGVPDASYIRMNHGTPLWQLGSGWYSLEGRFRWTEPWATARLYRPGAARQFELTVNLSPQMLRDIGGTEVQVTVNGQSLGKKRFAATAWQSARWDLDPAPAGEVDVEFHSEPAYHPPPPDSRVLGVPIGAFGFVTNQNP